ncbi:MAG: glycosyltransferase family 39 protein, partial [Candidatus Woesearchaeota archaeon]
SKLSVRYSISLFTEPLFILAMFASLYYFVSLFEQKSNKNYVLFTIFAAIAMQTRITGIFLFFALFSYLLFFERKHLTKKFLISFVVSGLIFLPYLILTDAKFLFEKSAVNYEFYHSFFLFLTNLAEDLSVSFVVLLCAALIFYHLDKRTRLIFYVAALYFIALMPTVLLNVRHVYPVFILLCTLIGGSFATDKKKRQFLIMSLLIFAFIAHNVYSYQQILGKVYQEYFVDVPEDCLELRNMKINGNPYNLPRFDQPASTEEYSTDFYLQKPSHYLIFEYDDDLIANIRLDNETLLEKYENSGLWSGFERGVVFMNISKGSHKLKFWIQNGKNVGGVAQVLVCKEFPNKNVEPKLFQLP